MDGWMDGWMTGWVGGWMNETGAAISFQHGQLWFPLIERPASELQFHHSCSHQDFWVHQEESKVSFVVTRSI